MAPAAIALLLILVVLTGLTLRSLDTGAELYDRMLAQQEHFGLLEADLQRDALMARAGLLRSYDPLVREIEGLDADLALLKGPGSGEAAVALERLTKALQQQEKLIEQFKSSNALLQNSLAHFERLDARVSQRELDAPFMPAVRSLAAAMLHLTLDTSAVSVGEVSDRLDALERVAAHCADDDPIRELLAHGRLLVQVLPLTDAGLKALRIGQEVQARASLRAILLQRQGASRASARASRLTLYILSLALVILVVRLGMELRSRAETLRRFASFEHLIATFSMRLVRAPAQETRAEIGHALAELAHWMDADRAYLTASAPYACSLTWSREGVEFPPRWPARAAELALHLSRGIKRERCPQGGLRINVPQVARLPRREDRSLLTAQNLQGWTYASIVSEDGARVALGFDSVGHPGRITKEGELTLVGRALLAIIDTLRREHVDAERERLQARLRQAQRMETVGALASGIAHNFNNIIGAILGHAEMSEMDVAGGAARARNLEEIRRAGYQARELVQQILTFGGRRENRRRPVWLADCVRDASSMLRASIPQGIDITAGDIPSGAIVAAEPVQLQQAIINLCNNAAQAMDGSGQIRLSAQIHDLDRGRTLSHGQLPPGRYVSLAVCDAGRGMDETTLARIFEPFFTTRAGGNGLGLATVREIASECEGALNVASAVGAGSRFELWLPCLALSDSVPAGEPTAHSLGSGETLLVFDDNRAQLLRSEEILAALGYEPVGFGVLSSAVEVCQGALTRFDAAVVGHTQSGDGLAIAAAIRDAAPQLPVVFATATIEAAAGDLLGAYRPLEIIHRPLIIGEVAAALARSLAASPAAPSVSRAWEH